MTRKTDAARPARNTDTRRAKAKAPTSAVASSTLRRDLGQQASRFALLTAIGLAAAGAGSLVTPGEALAQCVTVGLDTSCISGTTANNAGRQYLQSGTTRVRLTVEPDALIEGVGFAVQNINSGGVEMINNGDIVVGAAGVPTTGGTAAVNLTANGGPLAYSGAGDIINDGQGDALRAEQTGVGSVDLNIGGAVRSATGNAIRATMDADGTGMNIVAGGAVEGNGFAGIWGESTATDADIAITANGTVRGEFAGILANQGGASNGDINITANGAVEGGVAGIGAEALGLGGVNIRANGPVRSTFGDGIRTIVGGGPVDIEAGDVTAGGRGISVVAAGQANAEGVRIDVSGSITSTTDSGIDATSDDAMTVDVAGNIVAGLDGLKLGSGRADAGGSGDMTVVVEGSVTAGDDGADLFNEGDGVIDVRIDGPIVAGNRGVVVRDTEEATGVTLQTGSITANGEAISVASNALDGDIDVTVNGDLVGGTAGLALSQNNIDAAGDIDVVVNGDVSGRTGVSASSEGTGSIDIAVTGDIVGSDFEGASLTGEGEMRLTAGSVTGNIAGIVAHGLGATSGDITVNIAGDVTAQAGRGFESIQDGTGATNFTTGGAVTGTDGDAVHVRHTATDGGDVNIDIGGAVSATGTDPDGGSADGIDVVTSGLDSNVTVRTRGAIEADGYGVIATVIGGGNAEGDISIATDNDVSGALGGIAAYNTGDGQVTVTANGDVTSTTGNAIDAIGRANVGVHVAGNVAGGFHGVSAIASEAGGLAIDIDGSIDAVRSGVSASNGGSGGARVDVSGSITAGTNGVLVNSNATGGDVDVRVVGDIQANIGVHVASVATQSDISITTEGDITATSQGIRARRTLGQGDTTVQAGGDVTAGIGIDIDQGGGAGDVSITGSGTITGTAGAGIRIANNVGSISLDVANVTGATNAIEFINPEADSISITGSGDIIAQNGNAIRIDEVGPGGVSIVRSGLIQSEGDDAIVIVDATPNGGDISVSVEDVTARGPGADGIAVLSSSDEAKISIEASGDIRADGYGITALMDNNAANGSLFVRVNGALEGAEGGIDILSESAGAVDIASTGSISSQQTAVKVDANGVIRIDLEGPVTGAAGLDLERDANGSGENVVRTGAVTATDGRGIDFLNNGDRSVLIEARGHVSATNGDGINVWSDNGGDVTVIADSVTATGDDDIDLNAADGIEVNAYTGSANISITANGDVRTSEHGTGIVARHNLPNASGAINITARGDVYGGVGIDAVTDSTGAMTIVTEGAITGADAEGIYAETHGALDVVVNGHVTGYSAGVVLIGGEETGEDVTLTGTGGVTALAGNAVEARNDGDGRVTIDLSGDVVATDGSGYVVRALQSDNEDVSVTTGNVTAEDGFGVDVRMTATNADIDITTNGDVLAGSQGIYAAMGLAAQGDINVTANGSTEGFSGIHADNDGVGDINVIANGPVRGTVNAGILATGRRAVNVAVNGAVTGATSGLVVITGEAGVDADVTVTGTGSLVGQGGDALAIGSTGTGDVTVDIAGTLTSSAGHGVAIGNTAEGGDIRVRTGAISATQSGVAIQSNANAGELVIDIDGDIDAGSQGIIAAQLSTTSEADIDITARGDIRANSGIVAEHRGAGDIAVEVLGSIFSDNGAIIADGKGAVTIAVAGDVVSERRGISIGGGVDTDGDIDVTVGGTLTAGNGDGLFINNAGEGRVTVDIAGAVTATGGAGVLIVSDDENGGDVDVSVEDVTAEGDAVFVSYGSPTASIGIQADGDISGGGYGIFAGLFNDGAEGDITVIARGDVSGQNGIFAGTTGAGAVFVRADGDVEGLTSGIGAQGQGAVTIEANGTVSGRVFGATAAGGRAGETADIRVVGAGGFQASEGNALQVLNNGWGDIIVDIAGDTSATGGTGVLILDNAAGGDVEVTLGGVQGNATALVPETYGVDMRLATLTGDARLRVTGDAFGSTGGILAGLAGATATGDVTIITEGDVAGGFGIAAFNNGFGALSVTAQGDVTAETGQGIEAVGGGAVDLTVNGQITAAEIGMLIIGGQTAGAGDIVVSGTGGVSSATDHAIVINNLGTGGIQYDLSGALSSVGGHGLLIRDLEVGGDITVVTGDVTALDGFGLNIVSSSRDADLDVTVEGAITAGLTGILALRDENTPAATGDISINATGPIVAGAGILARNVGTGSTSVVANGAVQANDGSGVVAEAEEGDVSVEAGTVTATGANTTGVSARRVGMGLGDVSVDVASARGARGILASNDGDGDVIVTAATATGTVEEGIVAQKLGAGTGDVSVTVGSATGRRGVLANNLGTGAARVVSSGAITGAQDEGVFAASAGAGGIVVDVNNVTGGTHGVRTSNSGSGATEIDISGTVAGASAAVLATSTGAQAVRVTNSGTIRNTANRSSDLALAANGGQIDVANSGSLLGRLVLQGNLTSTVNSGVWNSINGVSQFQGGDDRLSNAAAGVITGGVNASAAETTVWAGLESFTNSGLLDLGDGGTGDLIATSANTVLAATSTLQVDIAGASLSDAFRTTGTLSIAAGAQLDVNFIQPLVIGARWVVAEALQGLDGEFVFEDRLVSAFLGLRDGYTDTEAYIELAQLRAFEDAGDTPNRRETGRGLDTLPGDNPLREAVLVLPDDGAARAAFDQLSGEIHPAMRRAMVDESRLSREAVLERLEREGEGRVWAHGLYGRGRVGADGNATRAERDTGGVIFGADGSIAPGVTIGAAGGWIDSDIDLQRRNSDGTARNVHAMGYAGFRMDRWSLRGGVGYSWTSVDTDRSVAFPGVTDRLRAEYDGSVMQAFLEAGYRVPTNGGYVEPFVNLTTIHANTDAFRETGGVARIEGEGVRDDLNMATAGFRVQTAQPGAFSARGMFGVRHMDGDLAQAGQHRFPGGAVFTILTSPHDDIAAVATFEADWQLTPWLSLGAVFDGAKGEDGGDHAITGRLKMAF
ncbi:MAG: hypothetical protein IBJ02_04425 [Brevundimonas sp.]|nr:hypothetical protein [Brevundimonas sp.]